MATILSFLVSILTSTASRYLFIFILVAAAAYAFYLSNHRRIALEREQAIYQYNLNQLQQAIKDKDQYIETLNKINEDRQYILNELIKKKEEIEAKIKEIEDNVNVETGKGNDRESSSLLKDVFKKLGNQK